jgi:hypothetical protein
VGVVEIASTLLGRWKAIPFPKQEYICWLRFHSGLHTRISGYQQLFDNNRESEARVMPSGFKKERSANDRDSQKRRVRQKEFPHFQNIHSKNLFRCD